VIRTPGVKRKVYFKTESGYKLRGAMVWVVVGIVVGILAAALASGLAFLWNNFSQILANTTNIDCIETPTWLKPIHAFESLALFAAFAIGLFMLRKGVAALTRSRYEEFADDVANWFALGSMLAYFVCGVPLILIAIFVDACS
jgi:hypothetical protein